MSQYATSRKIAGSIPNEIIAFSIYLILPAALDPRVDSVSNRNLKEGNRNSVAWVRERTIPTERPPLVGEVIANVCG
jgi:hypothetical protein